MLASCWAQNADRLVSISLHLITKVTLTLMVMDIVVVTAMAIITTLTVACTHSSCGHSCNHNSNVSALLLCCRPFTMVYTVWALMAPSTTPASTVMPQVSINQSINGVHSIMCCSQVAVLASDCCFSCPASLLSGFLVQAICQRSSA